ncbi:MAG: hypothetical protein U1F43_23275 [Myxococcota bacterium]
MLLNFPLTTLAERVEKSDLLTRRDWAEARLTGRFARRVPAEVQARITDSGAKADLYIANYNVWAHHVLDHDGTRPFPSGKKLISHWNLRDELKAQYANGDAGLRAQRALVAVMERIVTQTIPAAVIDDPRVDWNPYTNAVAVAPTGEVEPPPADAPAGGPKPLPAALDAREPDARYAQLLAQFKAWSAADAYDAGHQTVITRSFEVSRELSEARVTAVLEEVLTSPLVKDVAAIIEARLGRKLEPQDLWYDGFKPRSHISEAALDKKTKARWPTPAAFEKDLSHILEKIGFAKDKAKWLADHIKVDPARGAGHALQAARRGDFPRLRTRVGPDGMDYKGFNIAVHELGHNVEQTFSLYAVDHTLLAGVPNTAFTEALAFVFQARDLDVLGITQKADPKSDADRVLNDFWSCWEIAGVALVDVAVWHWLYDHPNATPSELRAAVVDKARELWTKYYAPVLGGIDEHGVATPLLGIYSHMIAYPLYLCDYPLGHLIAFQIEEHMAAALKQGKTLGAEFERMTRLGNVAPDVWMRAATGAPVSAKALLDATARAVTTLKP